jgi:translation initiation factor IF-3
MDQLKQKYLINEQITSPKVRVVDQEGNPQGVMSRFEALNSARNAELDLVLIVPQAQPPLCKIVDFGKFAYSEQKKAKEAEKKQRESRVDLKEMQFRPAIDDHDFEVKLRKVKEILEEGDKCRVVIRFRGREMNDTSKGFEIIKKVVETIDGAQIEGRAELAGNRVTAVLVKGKK